MSLIIQKTFCAFNFSRIQKFRALFNAMLYSHTRSNFSVLVQLNKSAFVPNEKLKNRLDTEIFYSKTSSDKYGISSSREYAQIAEETLQSISERFEELLEDSDIADWDVNYNNDVLTVSMNSYGVYVINKQSPNKQIWLSSPFSGPKRYDFNNGMWIYRHDGVSLHQLLSEELSKILQKEASFMTCTYGGK